MNIERDRMVFVLAVISVTVYLGVPSSAREVDQAQWHNS